MLFGCAPLVKKSRYIFVEDDGWRVLHHSEKLLEFLQGRKKKEKEKLEQLTAHLLNKVPKVLGA